MDTIKINKGNTKMVAHRGVSGLELENTCAAFVAAGNRSYFGIETDVHKTADGKHIIIHDDNTGRVGVEELPVEESSYEQLRALQLKQKDGTIRVDLHLPALSEYLSICKHYEKVAVLELKNPMEADLVKDIVEQCEALYGIAGVIFISFDYQNLLYVKAVAPNANTQFLLGREGLTQELIEKMVADKIDFDVHHSVLTKELIDELHAKGIVINCWTVDDPQRAEELAAWGVDYITSNILE